MFIEAFFIIFCIYLFHTLQNLQKQIENLEKSISDINKQYVTSLKTQLTILEHHIVLTDMCEKISNIFSLQQAKIKSF